MASAGQLSSAARAVRQYDRDRFVTALFAPSERREALFALYAFNLEIAQIREKLSEPGIGLIRLQWWRDQVAAIYGDLAVAGHPILADLAEAIRRFDLDRGLFDRLIDTRESDLADAPPTDLGELEDYAAGTSSTLAILAVQVLASRGEGAATAAHHVGVAWALTGLLRAVPFHARQGRVYLPRTLLAEHSMTPEDILQGPPKNLPAVSMAIADRAIEHIAAARRVRAAVPRQALPALLPARLAEGYLAALRRRGYDVFETRWAVCNSRPASLLVAALRGRY